MTICSSYSVQTLGLLLVVATLPCVGTPARGAAPQEAARASETEGTGKTDEQTSTKSDAEAAEEKYQPKTKAELRRQLSRIQYRVTQEEETEPAFRNAYWNNKKEGTYFCIVCEKPLFSSETKFVSGTGWPSFWQPLEKESIGSKVDFKMGYPRTEVHCERCKAHLGHVFEDGPPPTGLRFCMNSASLKFVDKSDLKDAEKKEAVSPRREP